MGFLSHEDIIKKITQDGQSIEMLGQKSIYSATAGNICSSLTYVGAPGAMTFPGSISQIIDYPGLISWGATSPATKHLLSFGGYVLGTATLNLMLMDILVISQSFTAAAGSFSLDMIIPRYADIVSSGVYPYVYAIGGGAQVTSASLVNYVNESGGTSTSPAMSFNIAQDCIMPLSLANGSSGVRNMKSLSLAGGFGTIRLMLAKTIAVIGIDNAWQENDLVTGYTSMPRIYDGASLGLFAVSSLSSTTTTFFFSVRGGYG